MANAEVGLADGIEAVSIVTPHDSHYEIATSFLDRGVHVICEKPLTIALNDALELHRRVKDSGLVFSLIHNDSGYPVVRQAASIVREGHIGEVRIVQVQHAQGPHNHAPVASGRAWPECVTQASVMYDLGTYSRHLLRFVIGLEVDQVLSEMTTHVPDRKVFDNVFATLRLSNGARGTLWTSLVAAGNEPGLGFRVYGEEGC